MGRYTEALRLTVHLNRVKPTREKRYITKDGVKVEVMKNITRNTLAFKVHDEDEAMKIVNEINESNPRNNVKKWYLSNIR
jgi:hypothetical protein